MPENYTGPDVPRKSYDKVRKRIEYLRNLNAPYMTDRTRLRSIMNGGSDAVGVLLSGLPTNEDSLPAANHILSGVERFSEMISPKPDLRINAPDHKDSKNAKRAAEKRERIVESYDSACKLEKQLVQGALWTPGYGFFSWKVREATDRNGYRYPKAELRDPYTTWPAEWGVDQEPDDIAYVRMVDRETLIDLYPRARGSLTQKRRRLSGGAFDLSGLHVDTASPGWDGSRGGVEVVEYVDSRGTYVLTPEHDGFLDFYEHPIGRPPFVVPRRFTFDKLVGQFNHVIGLASTVAKLTLLTQISMEEAAFAPIVVTGRMDGPFRKGRDAVNQIEGGDAKYLYQNVPYQMFSEIDRVENHLRTTTGYSQQADGQSPISFVTGQGLEELGSSLARQVERYQLVFKDALEDLDAIRLEWDEKAYGGQKKPLEGERKGAAFAESYTPEKDIDGHYRTRRVYGLMAGMDESRRIVGMLQLMSAGIVDDDTVRDNLSSVDNPVKVGERVDQKRSKDVLFESLAAMAQSGDPRATMAMVEVMREPKKLLDILEKHFSSEGEAESEEEQAFLEGQMGGEPLPDEPPPISQVLSRLTGGGEAQGGAQTVARTN